MPPATPSFRSVLWVDDNPSNNTIAADYLVAIQTSVTKVHSTRQALTQLRVRSFDAIISDMGRWEGQYEGYVLLDEIRHLGIQTPFFIFAAGGSEPQHQQQAQERGANGSTNSMEELLNMLQGVFFK
jgi:CheY-like chemotaxis protein